MSCTHNKETGSHQNNFEFHIQTKRNYSKRKKQTHILLLPFKTERKAEDKTENISCNSVLGQKPGQLYYKRATGIGFGAWKRVRNAYKRKEGNLKCHDLCACRTKTNARISCVQRNWKLNLLWFHCCSFLVYFQVINGS